MGSSMNLRIITEKSCSWSRNRVSNKIDFKGIWPRNGHADSVGAREPMPELKPWFYLFIDFLINDFYFYILTYFFLIDMMID